MKFIGNWKLYMYGSYDVIYVSLHPHFWGFANNFKEAAQISSFTISNFYLEMLRSFSLSRTDCKFFLKYKVLSEISWS